MHRAHALHDFLSAHTAALPEITARHSHTREGIRTCPSFLIPFFLPSVKQRKKGVHFRQETKLPLKMNAIAHSLFNEVDDTMCIHGCQSSF